MLDASEQLVIVNAQRLMKETNVLKRSLMGNIIPDTAVTRTFAKIEAMAYHYPVGTKIVLNDRLNMCRDDYRGTIEKAEREFRSIHLDGGEMLVMTTSEIYASPTIEATFGE